MPDARTGRPRSLIGASIPRSGHHHLARLLRGYLGRKLHYCSVYDVDNCCRTTPCAKPGGRAFVYQKSHDFDFRLPKHVAHAIYLIQHRHPVANALSDMELRSRKGGFPLPSESPLARARYYDFLAARLAYYRRFHDKWVAAPPAIAVLIDHERLEADPASVLREIMEAANIPVDEARLFGTVAGLAERGGRRSPTYRPRVVEDSPFFERGPLAALETAVIAECPSFGYRPLLGGGGYKSHPIWLLAKLRHEYGRATPSKRLTGFE